MRFLSLWFIASLLLYSCAEEDPRKWCEDTPLKTPQIILVAGQSNTHAGLGFDSVMDAPQAGIYQLGRFNYNQCIIPAAEPLDHHTRTEDRIGFALTFAKRYQTHKADSSDIIIVPCGFGGTGFIDNRWNKGNDLYSDAVARVRLVKDLYPDGELVAILWHQGETDILLENPDYQSSLDNFIHDIRTDLDADSVPFILGGMVPYWTNQEADRQQVQALLKDTPARHAKVGYADPEVPFVIEKPDNTVDDIHFDAAGQRELGNRYFEQFLMLEG